MNWSDLPSLSALRAFEAAARFGNLSAAAGELNVTHAAVAQHIRAVEDFYGTSLLVRQGRGMALTAEGQELSTQLTTAFQIMSDASKRLLQDHKNRALRIATTPSLAAGWLMPQIGDFWRQHPEIDVEILPNNDVVDLREQNIDIALRYGARNWSGLNSIPLISAGYIAVAAPDYIKAQESSNGLKSAPVFLSAAHNTEAVRWIQSNDLTDDIKNIVYQPDNILALQSALGGRGIAIVPKPFGAKEIEDGRLTIVFEDQETGLHYHIVTRPDVVSQNRDIFIRWLETRKDLDPPHGKF